MSRESLGDHGPGKIAIAGAAAGLLAIAGGIEVVRRQLVIPEGLDNKRVKTLRNGAIILTAGALALEEGRAMTLAQIEQITALTRNNTSYGVAFLEERGFAERQKGYKGEVDHIWGAEPLMAAAADHEQFPLLHDAIQQLTECRH